MMPQCLKYTCETQQNLPSDFSSTSDNDTFVPIGTNAKTWRENMKM